MQFKIYISKMSIKPIIKLSTFKIHPKKNLKNNLKVKLMKKLILGCPIFIIKIEILKIILI